MMETAHQCDRCLGAHPSSKCPHAEMPEPEFVRRSKGKGKKGSGKEGGRPTDRTMISCKRAWTSSQRNRLVVQVYNRIQQIQLTS